MKKILRRIPWLGRGKVTVLAVVVALVLVMAPAALAANGQAWILGKSNVATAITKLAGAAGVNGPMLQLINNNADANDTALDLRVQAGEAPMRVNSTTKVANLNADQLDGQDSSAFLGVNQKAFDADRLDGQDASEFVRTNTYVSESPLGPGDALGDGTHKFVVSCQSGDRLLSGGAANVDAESRLLESFPGITPDGTWTWSVRIHKNVHFDDFSAIALCANQ